MLESMDRKGAPLYSMTEAPEGCEGTPSPAPRATARVRPYYIRTSSEDHLHIS